MCLRHSNCIMYYIGPMDGDQRKKRIKGRKKGAIAVFLAIRGTEGKRLLVRASH